MLCVSILKQVRNKPITILLGIYRPNGLGHHMDLINHVYTMYISCIYHSRFDIPVIYQAYSGYIHGISSVYTMYIHDIYMVYPSGWCCGGGQGRGRAPTHLRGSAYILSRRHCHARAHTRTSARPRTPERASTLR